MAEAKAAG
jgi:hypothetical protein